MEYALYIQPTGSIGSFREHWRNASSPSKFVAYSYDSFNFNCLYTLKLKNSATVPSRDGITLTNDKYRRLTSFDETMTNG